MPFMVRDLIITVMPESRGTGGGDVGLVGPDQDVTDFSPISPWVHVATHGRAIRHLEGVVKEAVAEGVDGRAILESAAVRRVAEGLGGKIVGAAIIGAVGMPNPDCEGNSGLPTWISPIAFEQLGSLRVEDLPVLKAELKRVLETVEQLETSLRPSGAEAKQLSQRLEGALEELRRG